MTAPVFYACFDIGGTSIKHGVLSAEGKVFESSSMPTEAHRGPDVWMLDIVNAVEGMRRRYSIRGICISSAGMIDVERGKVVFALPQIPGYTGFDVKGFLESRCGLPCEVENDVNCMVLAESLSGAGKGYASVLGLTVGTGVGGGFSDHGRLLHGATFSACEVGYIRVGDGDLEHKGSTTALCRSVESMKSDPKGSWNGKRVFDCAKSGDQDCIRAIDQMADSLSQGLGTLCYILNPEVIVLGGAVMGQSGLVEKIRALFPLYVNRTMAEGTTIRAAHYGNEAGMVGALHHFLQRQGLQAQVSST